MGEKDLAEKLFRNKTFEKTVEEHRFVIYYSPGWSRIVAECSTCGETLSPRFESSMRLSEFLELVDEAIKQHINRIKVLEGTLEAYGWKECKPDC
ncbi:MAG: hypothetical protein DRN91_08480 [Candidatus Alkanophagales archaeon]|nr:MAG: hypothetical protein DRN91_08480 [Candidatus Alkanophagales archaeon]